MTRGATIDALARCDQLLRLIGRNACLDMDGDALSRQFGEMATLANVAILPAVPRWSGVTDDCTPVELSLAFQTSGPVRVRALVEAQDDAASPLAYWHAASEVSRYFEGRLGADLDRLRRVVDLFIPDGLSPLMAAWHSLEWGVGCPPLAKIYLSPASRGRHQAQACVNEALGRLGFGNAAAAMLELCSQTDLFTHLSLDLSRSAAARVKV